MDLILWRHAEAEEDSSAASPSANPNDWDLSSEVSRDLQRALTSRGEKQAARMAKWLDQRLPDTTRLLVSPARRCEQTALALGRKYKLRPELAPDATLTQMLDLLQWPGSKSPILVVGHQPTLGQAIAHLLGLQASECAVKKGAVWWLRHRDRDGLKQSVVVTVQAPELL